MSSLAVRFAGITDGLPRAFWSLWAGMFVNRAGSFVVPLLFVYLTQQRGLDLPTAGLIASLFGAGSLAGTLLGGALSDRLGRRATMLLALVTSSAFMIGLGLARETWQIASATVFLGFFSDMFRPASQALVADIVPPEHRVKAFSLQYWAVNLGYAFAAVLGGFMAKRSFFALFLGDALTTLVLAAIIWRSVPESRPAEAHRDNRGSVLTPFFDGKYLPFLLCNLALTLVFFQHLSAMPEDMRQKGLTTEHYGIAVATNCLLIVLCQPLVTRWVKDVPRGVLLAAAATLTGIGFGTVALASTLPAYMATIAVWTFGEIIFAPVNASIVADLSPKHLRGRYQGAFSLTFSFGAMGAPSISTRLLPKTGLPLFWLLCLVLCLAVAACQLVWGKNLPPPAPEEKP
ncbi:MDR family MFS transporter [Polyangium jinanense]|uniref:MFS transporter n=1 Tax=Polyangium jinanense TaxID=2829994 RepID=A0A9X3XC99_9BACT|nr:MFS transporter [Polyangium jinanense]MDC3955758.1 MFS transporter [Polyangium jinanense]MDC3986685.1 MFS transporter [Polyangium jinanense]